MTLKNNYVLLLCLFCMTLLSTACNDDASDDAMDPMMTTDAYEQGMFITNEGKFGDGTGTLSFYDIENNTIENDVFSTVNDGQVLGNVVQSMTIHNDKVYFMVNNGSKVEVANAGTLEYDSTIDGFDQPRYFLPISDDKAYVSEWGADGLTGAVNVLDLNDNSISKKVQIGSGAEHMVKVGTEAYIANSGGYGRDSTLMIFDTNADELVTSLYVGDNPNGVVVDKDQNIWVLAGGYSDWMDPNNNTNGALCKITNNEVALSLIVPNGAKDLVINPAGDKVYFSVNGTVVSHEINALGFDATPLISRDFYSLGIDHDGNIWGGDAMDYQSEGEVVKYSADGIELETYAVGIIPGYFWFE